MKRIAENIEKWGIQKQIQRAFLFMTVAATLLIGIGSYMFSKHVIEKNYKEDFRYSLEISENIIDLQMDTIIELGRDLLRNELFIMTLEESKLTTGHYFTGSQEKIFEQALGEIISKDSFISEAAVIDMTGKLYCYRNDTGRTYTYIREQILDEKWIDKVQASKGKEIFYSYNVLDINHNPATFSLVKKLINIKDGTTEGFLVINIRKQLLKNSFVNLPNSYKSNCFLALTMENDVAYFLGNGELEEDIMKEYQNAEKWNNTFVFSEVENSLLNWKLISVVQKKELTSDSLLIGLEILLIIFAIIFLSSLFSKKISNRIYRPLNQLADMIREVGAGTRNLPQKFDDSEVGQIGNQFREMVNNNLELRENLLTAQVKEREAELMLLQSQINPHFLYNTLDSIYFRAVIVKQEDIARMVEALSKTFRLSLNSGKKLIRVQNEIEHIRSYMEIQNIRFNNRFQLNIDVPDEIQDCFMLKFILQPFVENAMYHGLEPKIGDGSIHISAMREGENLYFNIADNGIGIQNMDDLYKGYGVKNVIERIKLFYGDTCGVDFKSEYGSGTDVKIKVKAL